MKKIFVDSYLASNLGDDLFLEILLKKYNSHKFTLNYYNKDYDSFLSQFDNVYRRRYNIYDKIVRWFKITDSTSNEVMAIKHDALLFIGGSIFMESYYHKTLHENRMNIAKKFKEKNKPIYILGANFGPFRTIEFVNDYTDFFKLCDDVCFRDIYSYELFKHLPQVRYAPDIVFQINLEKYKKIKKEKIVGYSIINVKNKDGLSIYYDDYIKSTINSMKLLNRMGYQCCLMSFCEREGDLEVINDIKNSLPTDLLTKCFTYNYQGNINESIDLIATFKLLVAGRFHANVLAILLGIGVMPIIYNEKTTNMLQDINLNDIMISMDKLHLQYDENTVYKSLINKIDNIEELKTNSQAHFNKMNHFLKD